MALEAARGSAPWTAPISGEAIFLSPNPSRPFAKFTTRVQPAAYYDSTLTRVTGRVAETYHDPSLAHGDGGGDGGGGDGGGGEGGGGDGGGLGEGGGLGGGGEGLGGGGLGGGGDGLGDGGGLGGGDGGGGLGQAVPSAVPPMPPIEPSQWPVYDVPTLPTLTRSPHSPALLNTRL